MKAPANMTNEQLIKWFEKTCDSLNRHNMDRPENPKTDTWEWRMMLLADKWADLNEEMVKRNIWNAWCDSKGFVRDMEWSDSMA
tara:strand:+ start:664 stop:915 length:252 start_codon:yes stop_codon:yes gene_type:complete